MSVRQRVVLGLALACTGCSLAPEYKVPATPEVVAYRNDDAWKAAVPADRESRGAWWTLFGDAYLNELEEQLAASSLTLQAAYARYQQSRALAQIARAGLFPSVGSEGLLTRNRQSANRPLRGATSPTLYTDALLSANVTYELDFWGRVRNSVEAARVRAEAAGDDYESAKLSLGADLADNYFILRGLDSNIALLRETEAAYQRALELTESRYRGGVARLSDVEQAWTQLETARALRIDSALRREQLQNAIAVLLGQVPESFSVPAAPLEHSVPAVPAELPSELLQRRPDIAAAERRVAAANADIGVARAAYYPTFSLSGIFGFENNQVGGWISAPNRFWAVGPAFAWPLFDGGRRAGLNRYAEATYDETVANYRQTVIDAYREVEDNLAAVKQLADARAAQASAAEHARRALAQTRNRYAGGIALYLEVVVQQNAALAAEQAELNARVRQHSAAVQLIKALGGGWEAERVSLGERK